MNKIRYDIDDPNIPEEYYESQEWMDYEDAIQERQQPSYNLYVPQQTHDDNWQSLREERNQPFIPSTVIDRVSNISLVLFANSEYQKGNLQCDIYKEGVRQPYTKNLIFEVRPELTPRQYRVWDLLITICQLDLKDCKPRRAKIFDAGNAQSYSAEFAYFEIWRNQDLIWACLLVEDWLLPLRIKLDEYQDKGDLRMSCAWRNKIAIDDWYKENI
jgi:hypothetical protein